MDRDFGLPTQYKIDKIDIDGKDVRALFVKFTLFENIYIPAITGNIELLDTDGAGFIEENEIEFVEDIEVSFTNALGDVLQFKGKLNGLRGEMVKESKRLYSIDFASEYARTNESTFVTKRFKNVNPEDVVEEMLKDKIKAENVDIKAEGVPMNFVGSRRKPFDVIKYVITHGVTTDSKYSEGQDKEGKAEGTTGFLCWETLKGYRFASIDQLIKGEAGENHEGFKKQLQNNNLSMDKVMNGVIDYNFPRIGNLHDKLRSGALNNTSVYLDLDKGEYKEINYFDQENMTDKEKEIATSFTRVMWKPISNERHNNECEKAQADTGDQTKKQLQQNVARQNTFDDQQGEFTLPPRFDINAGDTIEFKLGRVESKREAGYDKKHSGTYVVKSLAHHIFGKGEAYTKIATIRTNKQQDDASSKQ